MVFLKGTKLSSLYRKVLSKCVLGIVQNSISHGFIKSPLIFSVFVADRLKFHRGINF